MISRKVIAQSFTTFVLAVVAYAASKGLHISPGLQAELAGLVAWLGGAFAGWLAREDPALFASPAPPAPATIAPSVAPQAHASPSESVQSPPGAAPPAA